MARQYFTKSDVSAALARAVEQAEARGYQRGRDEAARFVEFASGLNGSTHAVVKSLRGGIQLKAIDDDTEPMTPAPAVDKPASEGDLSEVALLALMDVLAEAKLHHPDSDGGEMAAYLASLLDDPEALQAALGADVQAKAFDESKHPRDDNGRFVSREAIHEAKSDPEKAAQLRERVTDPEQRAKLDAALEGKADLGRTKAGLHREKVAAAKKQKTETINRARELANDISTARRGGEPVPAEHFKELATLLPSLTVQELRSVRGKLAASFFGRRNREDMVTALVRHAKVRAEQMHAEAAADDPLDFGMDAMYGTTGGTGKHGEDELNPWREFDKASDTRHGEAQHGGRIEQRKQVMNAVSDGAKTSHGTPDMGSVLKQAPEPKPVESESIEPKPVKLKERKQKSKPKTDTLYSHVVGAGGIDPKSLAFLAHYSGVNHAVENGLSRGLFKNGGRGLDQIVRELHASGHISGADEAEATENLLEGLRTQGYSNHADRTKEYEAALDDYYRKQEEARDAGHDESSIAAAIRSGEEAAKSEVAEGASGEGREDVGDAFEGFPEASGDDFEFGANEVIEPAPQADPFSYATTDHTAALQAIPRDSLGWVGGHRVRALPVKSKPKTREEYIANRIEELRSEYPGNDDETYQAQAELNAAEDFKPPAVKGKYEVGQTVHIDGKPFSYRGTSTGKDGNKFAVVAGGSSGQFSVPLDKLEYPPEADDSPRLYQIETQKTYHTGTAQEISDRIKDHWRMASGQKNQVNAALARADSYQEPNWFGGGDHADEVLRRRSAIPPGARGVSLEPNTRGRTGEVVRDAETGQTHLLLDGGKEIKATDFEPLESRFSWRVPEADKPKQERAKQGDLFAANDQQIAAQNAKPTYTTDKGPSATVDQETPSRGLRLDKPPPGGWKESDKIGARVQKQNGFDITPRHDETDPNSNPIPLDKVMPDGRTFGEIQEARREGFRQQHGADSLDPLKTPRDKYAGANWQYSLIDNAHRPDILNGMDRETEIAHHKAQHRNAVAAALAAGKPVPPEVLADYPDLAMPTTQPTDPHTNVSTAHRPPLPAKKPLPPLPNAAPGYKYNTQRDLENDANFRM